MVESTKKSNASGDARSHGSNIPQGSARETPSSRASTHLPLPKEAAGEGSKNISKGGSSIVTTELRIFDSEDGKEWIIKDEIVIRLLKEYKSAPDQRTKDEILKRLEERVASLHPDAAASQIRKNLPEGGANISGSDGKLMDANKRSSSEAPIANPKGSPVKIEERQPSKITMDFQIRKNLAEGGAIGGSDGKLMDANKRSSSEAPIANPKDSPVKIEERQPSKITMDFQNLTLGTDSQAGKAKEVEKSTRKK